MRTKLPRWHPGSPILHGDLNALSRAAERADNLEVDGSSGLTLTETLSGRLLSLNLPDAVGFGYTTTSVPGASGNVAQTGMLKICAWVETGPSTRTFTDLGLDPEPCTTPDVETIPAGKRVWWRRDTVSGRLVIDGALCPLTSPDPTPATA